MEARSCRIAKSIILVLGLLFVCPHAWAEIYPEGVAVVQNPTDQKVDSQTLQLEELWRAGGEDSEVIFGHIFRAEADADGNVYLLDTQQSNVPVFSPSGEHLRTLSREGEGPGETHEPVDLTMMPDGTLGILQRFPGKAVKITLDDVPVDSFELGSPEEGGFSALYTGRCRSKHLVMVAQRTVNTDEGQNRFWYVSKFDADGQELVRCFEVAEYLDNANPVISENLVLHPILFGSTVGPDGRVYVAPHYSDYGIYVYSPDGQLDHVVTREFEPRTKTKLENDRLQSVFDVWSRGRMPTQIEENAVTIGDIYIDDANEMWVRHSRSGRNDATVTGFSFDVFSTDGRLKRQVTLACEANPADDQIFRVNDQMLVLVKGSIPAIFASMAGGNQDLDAEAQLQEMEVVCYRLPQ